MTEKFADTDGLSETINRRPDDAIPNSVPQHNTQNLIIELGDIIESTCEFCCYSLKCVEITKV
jgi:hypothetical protein